MQMKEIPSLGVTLSRLGLGVMRLPEKDGRIDYDESVKYVDMLYEAGVNYYDTAYFYHNEQSEPFVRRALVERYPRDSYYVATKLPGHLCKEPADMERIFETQRERLGLERIDFYLLHGINYGTWGKLRDLGVLEFVRRLKAEGKIRFFGLSFHGANEDLAKILDEYPCDFCQIQLNYADWAQREASVLYEELRRRGLPVIVMEPVRGGGLARLYPAMEEILRAANPNASNASWAMRWCGSLPAADVILSGMSTMEQCRDNAAQFAPFVPLTEDEYKTLDRVVEAFENLPLVRCTGCKYCIDCPQEINIPDLFERYNSHIRFQSTWPLANYLAATPKEKQATACIECGACEERCPQELAIIEELKKVHAAAEAI